MGELLLTKHTERGRGSRKGYGESPGKSPGRPVRGLSRRDEPEAGPERVPKRESVWRDVRGRLTLFLARVESNAFSRALVILLIFNSRVPP